MHLTVAQFWALWSIAAVLVLAVAYGIGWGLTNCPRWFLACECREPLESEERRPERRFAAWLSRIKIRPPRKQQPARPPQAAEPDWAAELHRINRERRAQDVDLRLMTAAQVDAWLDAKPLERPDWLNRPRGTFAFRLGLPIELVVA